MHMLTAGGMSGPVTGVAPDVPTCGHRGIRASSAAASTGSQYRLCQDGKFSAGDEDLREADPPSALGRGAVDLGDAQVDVPQRQYDQRHEPAGRKGAKLIDDEVVVGLDAQQRQFLIFAEEEPGAGVAAERREADLGMYTVGVHVLDPCRRVITPRGHILESDRIEVQIRLFPAGGRRDAIRDVGPALVEPHLIARVRALGLLDHPRSGFFELVGQPILPDIGVFDDVIVDRDQFGVIRKHIHLFQVLLGS